MIKLWYEMTPEDKQKFYKGLAANFEKQTGMPWHIMEAKIRDNLDRTFDDARFLEMSPDDQIDAAYARKEFGKNKPSLIDFMIWHGRFVTHSDYVEF